MPAQTLTPWHVSFGLRLRAARESARYSTRQVARLIEHRFRLHLSHGSIARIERGEQRLSVGMLGVLCAIYDVAPVEIAVGVDPPENPTWATAVGAGLERQVVAGVVWLEQMLDHGDTRSKPAESETEAADA